MTVDGKTRHGIIQLVVNAYNATPGTELLADLVEASDETPVILQGIEKEFLLGTSALEPRGLFVIEKQPEVEVGSAEVIGSNKRRKKSRTNRRMKKSGLY